MKKNLYILAFLFVSCLIKAQGVQNIQTAVFEYVSAEFDNSTGNTLIQCKDDKGEIFTLQILKCETIKNAGMLVQSTEDGPAFKKTATNTGMLGKKMNFKFQPLGEIDPASPYCCYKIIEVNPL